VSEGFHLLPILKVGSGSKGVVGQIRVCLSELEKEAEADDESSEDSSDSDEEYSDESILVKFEASAGMRNVPQTFMCFYFEVFSKSPFSTTLMSFFPLFPLPYFRIILPLTRSNGRCPSKTADYI